MSVSGAQHTKVIVTNSIPDIFNLNIQLRSYMAEAFSTILEKEQVIHLPIEVISPQVRSRAPQLTLVLGSCKRDFCDYIELRDACNQTGSILAFWLLDDPFEFDSNVKIFRIADFIFTNDRWASEHFHRKHVYHLPLAASPTAHSPRTGISENQMQRDVLFAGAGFPNRRRIIQDLSQTLTKVKTEVFGFNWNLDKLPFCRNQWIPNNQLQNFFASSRIVLNLGRDLHFVNTKYQLAPSTPGTRTFEAAMAGACQMMFADSSLEVMDYFDVETEIVLFNNPSEFESTLMELLHNPEKRTRIGAAARRRCLKEHTFVNRAQKILNCTGLLKPEDKRFTEK